MKKPELNIPDSVKSWLIENLDKEAWEILQLVTGPTANYPGDKLWYALQLNILAEELLSDV